MSQLPVDQALTRFKENEERIDLFVNDPDGYTSSAGTPVKSLPALVEYVQETTGTVSENLVAAQQAEQGAEAARDAAQKSQGVFPDTASALSKGVVGTASLVAGSGGTNGTFNLGFSGGGGSGAAGVFVVSGGSLHSIIITNPGTGYTSAPALSFSASSGLTGASATAVIADRCPVGTYFSVPVSGTTDSLILYRVTAGPAATEVVRYPSAQVLARVTDLELASPFMPGTLEAFRVIRRLNLIGANPAKFYSVRYFFRNDSGTRFNFTVRQHDDAAGTNSVDVCQFSNTGVNYSGMVEFTLTQMGGSGITGTLVVDFTGAASTWAVYGTVPPATFATTAIRNDVVITSSAFTTYLDAKAASATDSLLGPGGKIPFVDEMTGSYLRGVIRSIWLYGADPTHNYVVNIFNVEEFAGIPLTRVLIDIKDLTINTTVCRYRYQLDAAPGLASFLSGLPSVVKLDDYILVEKSNIYAVMELDKSKIVAFTTNNPLTMAQGGIHKSRVLSDEHTADYLDRDYWHETIRVGAGQTFTTLRAAVESLYDPDRSGFCNRSHYHNRILIDLVDDGTYNATYLTIPEFVEIRGNGLGRTFIEKENTTLHAVLEAHLETKFRDCTIISDTGDGGSDKGQYCIHSDNVNAKSRGGKAQNRRIRQVFKRMELIAGPNQDTWIFGCGISSGEIIRFEDVLAEHRNLNTTFAAFGFHNTGPTISVPGILPTYKPPLVEMVGCRSKDPTTTAVYLQTLEPGAKCHLSLRGCDFNMIRHDIAGSGEVVTEKAADRVQWSIGGVHSGPILFTDPEGAIVLGTSPGVAVSGTAAAVIFGTVDDLGRGDLWIKNGTAKSLGARLGDCTSATKALTIGGQTWTANQNFTAMSNTTIIASINAAITSNPVSEVDIQREFYPDTGFNRRMKNVSGVTIPKGRFVKRTGSNTVALAEPGDVIFGWTFRDILNGSAGTVVTTRSIAQEYIGGASSGSGLWGISSAGQLSYSAATKIGNTVGGVVSLGV